MVATPQLHTLVTCTACGTFRRYFCMPGRGVEGDRWEAEAEAPPDTTEKAVEQSHDFICQDPSGEDMGMTQDVVVLKETGAQ